MVRSYGAELSISSGMLVGNVRKLSSNTILLRVNSMLMLFVCVAYLPDNKTIVHLLMYLFNAGGSPYIHILRKVCLKIHHWIFFAGVGGELYISKWGVLRNLFVRRVSYWYGSVLKCVSHQIFGTIYCHNCFRCIQFCVLSCCDSSSGGKSTCQYLFLLTFTTLMNLLVPDFTWLLLRLAGMFRCEGQSESGCTFYII